MKILLLLAAGAALLASAALVLIPGSDDQQAPVPPASQGSRSAPPGADAAGDAPVAPATDAPRALEPNRDGTAQCLLEGRVLDQQGNPIGEGRAWVAAVDATGRSHRIETGDGGQYALEGLRPGLLRLRSGALGFRNHTEELELAADRPIRRMDLRLHRAVVLPVRLQDPEGRFFWSDSGTRGVLALRRSLVPVATTGPPPRRLENLPAGRSVRFGAATFYANGSRFGNFAPEVLGVLVLDGDLPVFASLTLRKQVLLTELVDPGAEEAVFLVSPETLRSFLTGIRIRTVAAGTGEPVVRALVRLAAGDGIFDFGHLTDGEGVLVLEDLKPGEYVVSASAPGFADRWEDVLVPPGQLVDVGTLELEREILVDVRVVDEAGQPAQASFLLGQVGPDGGAVQLRPRRTFETGPQGRFTVRGLGPGRYVLRMLPADPFAAEADSGRPLVASNVVFTVREQGTPELVVPLTRASFVDLFLDRDQESSRAFRILDGSGLPIHEGRLPPGEIVRVYLPPGRYRLEAGGQEDSAAGRTFQLDREGISLTVGG